MQDFIKKVNSWPLIVKLLLCIPFVEIFYGICRIINQVTKSSVDGVKVLIAILTIIPFSFIMWLVDLIWVLMYGRAFLLD